MHEIAHAIARHGAERMAHQKLVQIGSLAAGTDEWEPWLAQAASPQQRGGDLPALLIEVAARRGRLTRPDLITGLCGEHGAVPKNIRFCMEAGLNYVSCSSYSVPIAALTIAQLKVEKQ